MPKDAKDFVDFIVKAMVEKPELVKIVKVSKQGDNVALGTESSMVLLEIHVDESDLGKVIGKSGRTIKSIRSIVNLLFKDRNLFVDIAK